MMVILSSIKMWGGCGEWKGEREKRLSRKRDMGIRLEEKMNFFKLEKLKECVFFLW